MARPAKYRERLPQLDGGIFLSDGGLETTLIFHEGWDLPCFAAFVLLDSDRGRKALSAYYDRYVPMAIGAGAGFMLESPTWRANPDWGAKVGYGLEALERNNRAAVEMMMALRDRYETAASPVVVSGVIGPRGDGYDPGAAMRPEDAEAYHAWQIGILRDAGADLVSAYTMTNSAEALGVARAAKAADGLYMINCAHPTHFDHVLDAEGAWMKRLRGLRANSSRCSHAELDNAPELDEGDPFELGGQYAELLRRFPHINVLGGCCGTDHRHLECISAACREAA